MTARDNRIEELSPVDMSEIINLSKNIPVEKIKLGTKIKLQSAMDFDNDYVTPQVEERHFEENKKIEIEKLSDKKRLMIEKTKKLQLKLESNYEAP
jgi:hypothetical protein